MLRITLSWIAQASLIFAISIPLVAWSALERKEPDTWSDLSPHKISFVTVDGVRLQYLDWGGDGPPLILIHGLADNPHIFDDLAPAFTDRFHVIAYARRGHGESDATGPYDNATLTNDLLGLMNALEIKSADLVGWSMGGNEITALAAEHPERVNRLVYFDSYDTADPEFVAAFKAIPPSLLDTPLAATKSLDAFRSYQHEVSYSGLTDMGRIEAYLRDLVVVHPDGSVHYKMSDEVMDALLASLWTNPLRDYTRVRAPALALYADSAADLHTPDKERRDTAVKWEKKYMEPFREKSIARMRQELANVKIVRVPGTHQDFFLTDRTEVVKLLRDFLVASRP